MVHNDMQLRAEIPLPSLERGALLRVPLSRLILGGGRGVKQCGIQHRAVPWPEALACLMLLLNKLGLPGSHLMCFQLVPEFTHRDLIRQPCFQGLPGRMSPTQGVLHQFLGGRSRGITPLLQTMQTRLQRQIYPQPTPATLHHTTTMSHQCGQRQQLLHRSQKLVPPSRESRMVCRQQGQGNSHRLGRRERRQASMSGASLPKHPLSAKV